LIHVLISYELVGAKVLGIVSDAGGNNAGLIKLLRAGRRPNLQLEKVESNMVTFINPFDPTRRVAIWLCSTHNLKSIRNQLLSSKGSSNSPRNFQFDDVYFGWTQICDLYSREEHRKNTGTTGKTRMKLAAAHPDHFSKMDAHLAKIPFELNSILEQVHHLASQIGKEEALLEQMQMINKDGTTLTTYRFVLQFLRRELESEEFKMMNELVKRSAKANMNTIEYSVSVGVLFIEIFMNKDMRLTRDTIDDIEQEVCECLRFLAKWMEQIVSRTTKDNKAEMDRKFMSRITYSNLRTGIAGFFQYARIVFKESETMYVPFLHSNTSTLEALFSQMRSMNRDTPERYISGLAAVNTHHAVLAMKRNKMYCTDQIGELTSVDPVQGLTKWRDKERKAMVDCWLSTVLKSTDSNRFPVDFTPRHEETMELFEVMNRDVVRGGWFEYITTNKLFERFVRTSIFTPNQCAFEELYKLNNEGRQQFELICQDMAGQLYHLQESSICGKCVSKSFHFQLLTWMQTTQELTNQLIVYKPSRPCAIILFHVLSTIFKDWIKDALSELSFAKQESTQQQSSSSVTSLCSKNRLVVECTPMIPREDENREVTDFFGWAIHSLRHVLSNEYARMQELKWETTYTLEEEEEMIRFVDQMRIFHTEALLDKQYLHECYTSCHQLKNKGWLSLVAKEYFPFARYLLHQIRSSVNVQEWARRGNGVIESAAKTLEEDKSLAVLFLDAAKSCSLDEKMKKKIMSALIRKVLHARAAAEHDKFKEQKTNREAQGSTTTSFRGALKVLSKRNEKGKKTKKQRTSASIDDIGEHNSQMCLDE
jgi:hypothetical protein